MGRRCVEIWTRGDKAQWRLTSTIAGDPAMEGKGSAVAGHGGGRRSGGSWKLEEKGKIAEKNNKTHLFG